MSFSSEIRKVVGDHVLETREEIIPYLKDASYFVGDMPDMVVLPGTSKEVSEIVKLCYQNDVQITVRGGGTSLTGSSVLTGKGIIISLARLDHIYETSVEDKYVVAEPGVRLDVLNNHLLQFNHFYPPDPASSKSATVGGTISTNAGGLRAAMYGTTKDWVLGLEVVLPTGEIVQFGGKTLKKTLGYDLTALMIGAEGTLGIITKAILKIWPIPEITGRIQSYYTSIEDVGNAVSGLKREGVTPMIAEFMDKISLDSIRKTKGLKFPEDAEYMLLIDIASTVESLERNLQYAANILKKFNPITVNITTDKDEMAKMYEARKGAYASVLSERESADQYLVLGDIVVPASKLPSAMKQIKEKIKAYGGKVSLYGHIGDGNIHAHIFANTNNPEDMKKVDSLQMDLARIAIKHEGSVSGEHGIGLEKKELLKEEMKARNTMGTLEMMESIKKAFDPKNLLNRGKIF